MEGNAGVLDGLCLGTHRLLFRGSGLFVLRNTKRFTRRQAKRLEMTIPQLWYLIIFAWGITCGWAVVKGISDQ